MADTVSESVVSDHSGQILGDFSINGPMAEEEEISKSALLAYRAKEEGIQKLKTEVKEKVQAQLGRIEEETKRLSTILEELETLGDPLKKEVSLVRRKIDATNKDLKTLGLTCRKKEREYKETLEALNDRNKEKSQLLARLMELLGESERLRLKKLEELNMNLEETREENK